MKEDLILFADFEPGEQMGEITEIVSDTQLSEWAALYPHDAPDDGTLPGGFATVLMMRAYLAVVSPRPPGNLHVRQQMRLHAPMRVGEPVITVITCQAKELKRNRRKLELRATGRGHDGTALYDGVLTLYWAA